MRIVKCLIFIFLALVVASCASSEARQWGPWKRCGLSNENMDWRTCSKEKDRPELHMTGFCYVAEECRERTTIFGNVKQETRSRQLHCKWGDIDCMYEYGLEKKVLVNP